MKNFYISHEKAQRGREKKVYQVIRVSGCGYQDIRVSGCGYQSIRLPDIRGTGISEIVHAPNLKNKIGAGSALILSLRNSGENPKRFNGKRDKTSTKSYFALRFLCKAKPPRPSSKISMLSNKEIALSTSNHFTFSMLAFNNILISSKSFSSETGKAVHWFSWL